MRAPPSPLTTRWLLQRPSTASPTNRITYADSQSAALDNADALVIVTEWKEFRSPDFNTLKAKLKHPLIFDGRNMYDPKLVRAMGIEYLAIGR